MSSLTTLEKRRFEDLFGMASGYVLDFTDRTFADFFRDNVKINIYDESYSFKGTSKARRMRAFWEVGKDEQVAKALKPLLELWLYQNPEKVSEAAYLANLKTVPRLLGEEINSSEMSVDDFLKRDFGAVSLSGIDLDHTITSILEMRIREVQICVKNGASLSAIILCGSILEGVLLSTAVKNPQAFNQSKSSPRDKNSQKVKAFHEWTLANFIDVAHECGFLRLDVKKFGHALRDFRNYIHPYEQSLAKFNPDKHTAEICLQVLKAALEGLKSKQ